MKNDSITLRNMKSNSSHNPKFQVIKGLRDTQRIKDINNCSSQNNNRNILYKDCAKKKIKCSWLLGATQRNGEF